MNDRLIELRQISAKNGIKLKDFDNVKINMDENLFEKFDKQKNLCQEMLEKIKRNTKLINENRSKYVISSAADKEKAISDYINDLINENNNLNKAAKETLGEMTKDLEVSLNENPDLPETRMKQNIARALSNKISEVLREYQNEQIEYKASLKEKISRQAKLVDPNISKDKMDDLMNDPQKISQMFQQKIGGSASTQMQNAVSDIQDKFRDIQKLEASVNVVFQMFVDLALMVNQQGESLDSIEISINDSKSYVEQGEKELIKAKELHMAAKKKMCCIACILLIVLGGILGPVLGLAL